MPVREQFLQFSLHEPTCNKSSHRTHGQVVIDAIFQPASSSAVGNKSMRVFPAMERSGALEVLELAAFDVSAMFEFPPHAKRPHAHSQYSARAIVNSRSTLQNFDWLPRRRQPFERAGFRVPGKDFLRRRFDSRSSNKSFTHDDRVSIWLDALRRTISQKEVPLHKDRLAPVRRSVSTLYCWGQSFRL